jgi:hypothetical protein
VENGDVVLACRQHVTETAGVVGGVGLNRSFGNGRSRRGQREDRHGDHDRAAPH